MQNKTEDLKKKLQSISTKVFLIMLISILPINILAISVSSLSLKNARTQTENSVRNVISSHISQMENNVENVVTVSYTMRTNDANARILTYQRGDTEYELARLLFYKTFDDTLGTMNSADGAFMYMSELDDFLDWNLTGDFSASTIKDYIIEACNTQENPRGWRMVYLANAYEDEEILYPVLIYISQQNTLYTGGWVLLSDMADDLAADLSYESAEVVFSTEKPIQRSSRDLYITEYYEQAKMYVSVKLDLREINGRTLGLYYLYFVIALVLLICLPLLYVLLRRWLIEPLSTINTGHAALEDGNLDYRIEEKATSLEYQKAFDSFNEMAGNLEHLTIENYEKEIQRQRMELKNLQLQIRPHFLLNIFNLIYNLAQEKDTEHVQQAILYLSDYFRYIFRGDKDLELFAREKGLIEGYIEIAKLRYPGCIEAEYDYDERILVVRVPPLLIHNFVENIIKHVVKQGTVTHIFIQGQYENKMVRFHVMDDGEGIDDKTLQKMNDRMKSGKITGEHVGMANSLLRLRYYYGEEADITVTSEVGVGTDVILSFPYDLEVQKESDELPKNA